MRKIRQHYAYDQQAGPAHRYFDGDVFTFDCQHTAFLEATQQTADGFYRQAQIVTDIATSHRQAEFTRGEAALGKTTGQVVDECSQTFLGIFFDNSRIMS